MDDAEKQDFELNPVSLKTAGTMKVRYVNGDKLKPVQLEDGGLTSGQRDAIRIALVHLILASVKDPSLEKHIETLRDMIEA
jgi:hypothetical protein